MHVYIARLFTLPLFYKFVLHKLMKQYQDSNLNYLGDQEKNVFLKMRLKLKIFCFTVYVDASENCNDLVFQLGQRGIGAAISLRKWSIKVIASLNIAIQGGDLYNVVQIFHSEI